MSSRDYGRARFLDRWKPDQTSTFSVGVTVLSDILTPSDLDFLVEKFDDGWEEAVPQARRAPAPAGSSLHVHLLDRLPAHASANLLIADTVLDGETMAALIAVDPDIWVEVHVKQDLPDVGAIPTVHLTPEVVGVLATSERFAEGLDVDQYGAEGYPMARRLTRPMHSRRLGFRDSQDLLVASETEFSETFLMKLDPTSSSEAVVAALAAWRSQNSGDVSMCELTQTIRLPGEGGIGVHLDRALLIAVAELGVGLDMTFRTRRPWES